LPINEALAIRPVYRKVPKLSTPPFRGLYLTLGYFLTTAVRSCTPKGCT